MTLVMLADLGQRKSLWWDAYVTMISFVCIMPTRTCRGWMSPAECVSGGQSPNLLRVQMWKCKTYVSVPKADKYRDWEDGILYWIFQEYSRISCATW